MPPIANLHAKMTQARRDLDALAQHINDHPARALIHDGNRDELAERLAKSAAEIADGEYRPAYNGWTNRETWNASLWINNDQGMQDAALEIVRDAMAGSDYDTRGTYSRDENRRHLVSVAADALKEWYDETFSPQGTAGPLSDVWTYALAWVDWRAVVAGLVEGMDPSPFHGYHE